MLRDLVKLPFLPLFHSLVQQPYGPTQADTQAVEFRDIFGERDVKGRLGRMMMEEENFEEMMLSMIMKFSKERERLDVAQ